MAVERTVKVAYDMPVSAKHKLAHLKADLRLQGIAATETGILTALLDMVDLSQLKRWYKRR